MHLRLKLLRALSIEERITFYKENKAIKKQTNELLLKEHNNPYFSYFKGEGEQQIKYAEQFMAGNKISETDLKKILSDEFLEIVADAPNELFPDWLKQLEDSYTDYAPDGNFFSTVFIDEVKLSGFFNPFEPLIRYGRKKLKEKVQTQTKSTHFNFEYEEIERQLINNIAYSLFDLVDRTLVLELNISKFENALVGDNPVERFESFVKQISSFPKLKQLIEDYPTLFRQAVEFIERWVEVSSRLVLRLNTDIKEIKSFFQIREENKIKKLHINAGDRHRGGETVVIITFVSGERIVYKPHSLSVDLHFQELLKWINKEGLNPPLKLLKLIDKKEYGWVEFVENTPCNTEEEVNRFYQRIGNLLAILYAINATDFHYENVIANGEHPMLIDLESLFHGPPTFGYDAVDVAINTKISESVLKIQLLPFKLHLGEGVVDISGITNMEGIESPTPVASWQASGTDDMKITKIKTFFSGSKNAPSLTGNKKIKILDYSKIIEDAFRKCYRIILDNRDILLSKKSVIMNFKDDEIRILLRNTATYAQLIRASAHPDHLQNYLQREKLFCLLWDMANEHNKYSSIIPMEKESMNQMDVPFFHTKPGSMDLFCNGKTIRGYYERTGLEQALNKIAMLSEKDCEQQCWFIRASLSSSIANHLSIEELGQIRYAFKPALQEAQKDEIIKTAVSLGDRILKTSIRDEGFANWASMILVDGKNYDVRPLMVDLYSGLPGVSIFFAALYTETKETKYLTLLDECLNNIRRLTDRYIRVDFAERIGAFDGWAGIVYAIHFIDSLINRADIKAYANQLLEHLLTKLPLIKNYDIIDGMAGVAVILKNIYTLKPSAQLLDAITVLGDKLADAAIVLDKGAGWKNEEGTQPLTGFGHGASGISYALFEINKICPKPVYLEKAIAGIEFESSMFMAQIGNWMDLRVFRGEDMENQTKDEMIAWCHGAVGVGISRVNMLKQSDHEMIERDLKIALRSTIERGFGQNHSLCHGDFGNLELLLQCAEHYNDANLKKLTYQICKPLLEYLNNHDCIGGVALGVENPSLMIGTAGVGYQLLRLSDPEKYPSVLTLSLPVGAITSTSTSPFSSISFS